MIFKNASDQAERIREALDHLDDVRMPKESREQLKQLRRAIALLVIHTVREMLLQEPGDVLLQETSKLAVRVMADTELISPTLRALLSPTEKSE